MVRHGETPWNAEKRIQGGVEISLNEKGRLQAHAVGKTLSSIPMDVIYSSPQKRAHETARILQEYHKKEIVLEDSLRERRWGEGEGLTQEEFLKRYEKERKKIFALGQKERNKHRWVPQSETVDELADRVIPCLQRLSKAHPGQNVLVVAHGWVIKVVMLLALGWDEERFFVTNGAWIHVQSSGDVLQIVKHEGVRFE